MIRLPDWARREEIYKPENDRDIFISRSLLRLMKILFALKRQAAKNYSEKVSAAAALAFVIFVTLLCVGSHTKEFLLCVLAPELVLLCFLSGEEILGVLKNSLSATFFCGLLILPAIFFGGGNLIFLLPAKTFLTVTALRLLTEFFSWHKITAALRRFKVPALVIFILDTTIKYIFLLGRQAEEILTALKLRSVGKNSRKGESISGVLGVTFLKSRKMSEEMFQAMCCRCFVGEYPRAGSEKFLTADLILLVAAGIYLAIFFATEGVFR